MRQIKIYILILLVHGGFLVSAQKLSFNAAGEFKIVQFTDTHIDYKHGFKDPVFDLVTEIVDEEKPDLVMFTGDIVVRENPREVYSRFEKIFATRKLHWAVVLGNHDEEHGSSRIQVVEILEKFPYCLTTKVNGIKGGSNFALQVMGKDRKPRAILYGIDSNSGSKIADRETHF